MQEITPRHDYGATRNFVLDDVPIPPAQVEQPPPPPDDAETRAALLVVMTANIAMSAIIIGAMLVRGSQTLSAILAGCAYYLTSTVAFTFIITGTLTGIFSRWARENTERRRIDAYQELGAMMLEWRMMQETTLTERRGSTEGVRRLSPLGDSPNYVTPYLEGEQAAVEGLRFACSLYGADGRADPHKVQMVGDDMGRLKVRMPGSKRGGGSRESGIWLLKQGVIVRVRRGFALNLVDFPTVTAVRRLL